MNKAPFGFKYQIEEDGIVVYFQNEQDLKEYQEAEKDFSKIPIIGGVDSKTRRVTFYQHPDQNEGENINPKEQQPQLI